MGFQKNQKLLKSDKHNSSYKYITIIMSPPSLYCIYMSTQPHEYAMVQYSECVFSSLAGSLVCLLLPLTSDGCTQSCCSIGGAQE